MTAWLEPDEAERFRSAFENGGADRDVSGLSTDGQTVYTLLTALNEGGAETALHVLPPIMRASETKHVDLILRSV